MASERDAFIYNRARWKIFFSLFFGYSFYYCTRKTFTFSIPTFVKTLRLGKDNQHQLGLITSCYTLAYGLSKFIAGFLADRTSSRAVFTTGLLLSGVVNIVLGFYHSLWVLMVLWGLNGLVQGLGWPPCASLLKIWFKPTELGTLWSILTASQNLTASILPLMTSYLLINYGLKSAFIIPGAAAAIISIPIYFNLYNSPNELGLSTASNSRDNKQEYSEDRQTAFAVFQYPFFWAISVGYFAVAFIKFGMADWGQLYLLQEKKMSLYEAGVAMGMFEVGGFIGCAVSGYMSDYLVAKNPSSMASPRMPVVLVNLLGLTVSLYLLHVTKVPSKMVLSVLMGMVGCTTMGPINIYGVLAVENSPPGLTSTTHGFVALAASVGATSSGYPLSVLTRYYDWSGMMAALQCVSLATLVLVLSTFSLNCSMEVKKEKVQ